MTYKPGSHYKICDRTGFKVRAEDTREEWTGAIVSKAVFEMRQPQDMVRGREDKQSVNNPRPRVADLWVDLTGILYDETGEALIDEDGSVLLAV